MLERLTYLCAALLFCLAPSAQAQDKPGIALTIDVTHVAKDSWRVDYDFARPVHAMKFNAVVDYRPSAWKLLTREMKLSKEGELDVISADGKPFTRASVLVTTFDGLAPKDYSSFNRFSDGGTAVYLGHLQGEAFVGPQGVPMLTEIRLHGLGQENVIAPPPNRLSPGAERGYAYFGPAHPVRIGSAQFLIDPATPVWMRETMLDAGAKVSAYYDKAYQRSFKDDLIIFLSVSGFDNAGLSIKGGAVTGQLVYRFDGKATLADHPRYREVLGRLVAHELAHRWQINVARGGFGDEAPWIHEGGAEAMAIDGLLNTGIWSQDTAAAYLKTQLATCDKLGNAVDSYDGIYACGLARHQRSGVPVVALWRDLMAETEVKGEPYSEKMFDAVVARQTARSAAPKKALLQE
ncbi:MAG: hypothetical protein ACJ8GW_18950 [Massilia sp.]